MHFWLKVFGMSVTAIRFSSVLFSALTAPLLFYVGKKFFSFQVGLIASLLFSASTVHMFYAHDARVYSLFVLFTVWSYYLLLDFLFSEKKPSKIWSLTVVNLLLCYLHFFGFVVVFSELLICLLIPSLRLRLKSLLISAGLILLSYCWYIPTIIDRFKATQGKNWVPYPMVSDLYTMLWRFTNVPVSTVLCILVIIAALIIRWKELNDRSTPIFKMTLYFFMLNYLGLFLISLVIPLFIDRYLLFTSVFYYLIVALSVETLIRSPKYSMALSFIPVIIMFATVDLKKGKKTKIESLVQAVNAEMSINNSMPMIISPEWFKLNFTFYYNQRWFTDTKHLDDSLKANLIFPVNQADQIPVRNEKSLLLIDDNSGNSAIRSVVDQKYKLKSESEFGAGLKLLVYEKN
jgi:4-amino-4-deoxy-L-arabinose transferase-like glycosyltransferase